MAWYDYIAAAVPGVGAYFGQQQANTANRNINRENNVFSAKQAQLNRSFQERMSNTSWQRGVADMKAAGINPMLAFSQGGASQPSGNSAQGIAQANQRDEIGPAINTAIESITTAAQLRNLEKQNAQIGAQTRLTKAQARSVEAVQPVKELEGALGGFGKLGLKVIEKGFNRSINSAYRVAGKLSKHDKFGRWNKRTSEILDRKLYRD